MQRRHVLPVFLATLVLLWFVTTGATAAAKPVAGKTCSNIDATTANGRLRCTNTAKSGSRPRLRWTASPASPASVPRAAAEGPLVQSPLPGPRSLVVYSGRTYGIEDVYRKFTADTGIKLDVVTGSDPANRERLRIEGPRTAADVFLTVDISSLNLAADQGLLSPLKSEKINAAVPAAYRDVADRWTGLSRRSRVIYVNTQRVKPEEMPKTYEDLSGPAWSGRLCMRPGSHVYTQSLAANLVASLGTGKASQILTGIAANTKNNYIDSDTRLIESVNGGQCDATIANTYYYPRIGAANVPNVRLIFPNQGAGERGAHVNVSGAGIVAASSDKDDARTFVEWMATTGNAMFALSNFEYPINPKTEAATELKALGAFKADEARIDEYSKLQPTAAILLIDAGWK